MYDDQQQPYAVEEITRAMCGSVKVPVWVKLTPNIIYIATIGEAAENRVKEITSVTRKVVM